MKSEEMTQNEMVAAAEQVTVTTCEKNLEKKMEFLLSLKRQTLLQKKFSK